MKLNAVDVSKIVKGDLAVGEALRQDEIAKLFNVSRIPVREAISRLEHQGLVRTQRYRGAVVSGLSSEEATELFEFRLLVEPELIRRAVPQLSAPVIRKVRSYCTAFSESTDPMTWGDLNREFHYEIYSASRFKFHLNAIDNAMNRLERYLRAQLVMSDGMARANDEHFGILEACESGNADHASELTASHIRGARDSFLEHFSQLRS